MPADDKHVLKDRLWSTETAVKVARIRPCGCRTYPAYESPDGHMRGREIPGLGPIVSRFCRDPGSSRDNSSNSASYGPPGHLPHHITNVRCHERRNAAQEGHGGRAKVESFHFGNLCGSRRSGMTAPSDLLAGVLANKQMSLLSAGGSASVQRCGRSRARVTASARATGARDRRPSTSSRKARRTRL